MEISKISKTQYNSLKSSYLAKNRTMHSLYSEINKENNVNKELFFKLINKIREEEGLNQYGSNKKQKKRNYIIDYSDKAPNSYN